MHDLDLIRAEIQEEAFDDDPSTNAYFEGAEDFEDGSLDELDELDELDDEDAWGTGAGLGDAEDSPLEEHEENDLASEVLAATDEEELERAMQKVVRPRPPRPGHRPPPRGGLRNEPSPEQRKRRRRRRRHFLGQALKGIAKKALPVLGGAIGTVVAPGAGTAAGAALGKSVGKAFGLELEGLSPEDQDFEVARRIVRLGAEAADETDRIDPSVDDETAAKVGVIRASGKHAPGLRPRSDPASPAGESRPRPRSAGARRHARPPAQSGRWERRGDHIVLLGL